MAIFVPEVIAPQLTFRPVDLAGERALCAIVANRACAPRSELSCDEQWWREEVRLDGTATLALHHLYRAMDGLEAHTDAIAPARYCRLAHRFNLEVERIVDDTTALHCDIDAAAQGVGDEEWVAGRLAAGAKTSQAPCTRGLSKNGRGDAPPMVVGLAVTRDGVPVRHGVFPGHTVDVSTVAHVKDDLRGWQLSRGVFVGDAGMVWQEHRTQLGASGGK